MITTDGNKRFSLFAFPLIIQSVVTAIISATDSIMLGMIGQSSLSAITLAGQLMIIYTGLIMALCSGASALTAQYYGNKDIQSVKKVLVITLHTGLTIGTVFALLTFLFPVPIMGIYTNDPELINLGISYLRIIAPSFVLIGFSHSFLNIMKNTGGEKISSFTSASIAVLNIVLDALLIFGMFGLPKMGVKGAALATLLSRLVEFSVILFYVLCQKTIAFRFSDFFHSYNTMLKKYTRYTFPNIIQMSSWRIVSSLIMGILGHLGSDFIAASAVALIVYNIAGAIADGYADACGITIGHLLGRNELDEAKITADKLINYGVFLGGVIGLIICLSVPLIKSVCNNLTPAALKFLNFLLYFVAFKLLGKFHNSTLSIGVFMAGGDIAYITKIDMIEMWCVVLPLGLLSSYTFHLPPIVTYAVLNMEEVYKITFMRNHYKKNTWVKNLTKKEWANPSRYINEIRRKVFDEMSLGVIVIGSSGKISLCNNACASLLGSTVDEIEGSNYLQIFIREDKNTELSDAIITAVSDKQNRHESIINYCNKNTCFKIKVCSSFMEDEDSKYGVYLTLQPLNT